MLFRSDDQVQDDAPHDEVDGGHAAVRVLRGKAMAAGGLDGSFFDSMGMPESTEMPLSAADIHLPVEWDEAQILKVIFMMTYIVHDDLYRTYRSS